MELALIFAGAVVSGLVQLVKRKWDLTSVGLTLVIAGFSLLSALIFQTITFLGYWEVFIQVIISAGATYGFIIKNLK